MATFNVTNKSDAGPGSLRQAIADANAAPGLDEIVITESAEVSSGSADPIALTGGEIEITDAVVIRGSGRDAAVIDAGGSSRIFSIATDTEEDSFEVTIEGVTLRNGRAVDGDGDDGSGGCISGTADTPLTIRNATIEDCEADGPGGGILSVATLTIEDSTLTGNVTTKWGGGAYAVFGLTVEDSIITGNEAAVDGAGINFSGIEAVIRRSDITGNTVTGEIEGDYSGLGGAITHYAYYGGSLVIEETTISGNLSAGQGGGGVVQFGSGYEGYAPTLQISASTISGNTHSDSSGLGSAVTALYSGAVAIENSTISGNSTDGSGAIATVDLAEFAIRNSTIFGNTAGQTSGGLAIIGDVVDLESTIIAGNTLGGAASDITIDEGVELTATTSLIQAPGQGVDGGALTSAGNLVGVDPQLGALANNGGRTQTHLPEEGSPVIDAGSNGAGFQFDQRGAGFPREVGGGVDIGAIEAVGAPASGVTLGLSGSPMNEAGGTATVTATLAQAATQDVTVNLGFTGTATRGSDYETSAETITIAAGQTSGTITLTAIDDDEEEGDETIIVDITSVTGAAEQGNQQVTAIISANDGGGGGNGRDDDGCNCSSGGDSVTILALGAAMLWGVVSRRLARV